MMARLVIQNTPMKSDTVFMGEIERLIKTIAPYYDGHLKNLRFFKKGLSLEDVMSLLDVNFRLFSTPSPQRLERHESSQLRILKDLITRTLDYALVGPSCKKHQDLASRMGQDDVVLSMNYDMLIDNALYAAGKTNDASYHMNFFKVNFGVDKWKKPGSRNSNVSLLKLHGSLNWVRCSLCGSLLLYRYDTGRLRGWMPFRCPRCLSDDSVAEQVMIPPLHTKDYRDRDMAFLWVQADRMLKEFSKIICIGYSFSAADSDMAALLRRFRGRQTQSPETDFVSPDHKARRNLETLLGIKVPKTHQYDDLAEYLDKPE